MNCDMSDMNLIGIRILETLILFYFSNKLEKSNIILIISFKK